MFSDSWQSLIQYAQYNNVECLCLFGIAITYSLKLKKEALYFLILSLFFLFFDFIHSDIKQMDPNKYWRYIIWSGSELGQSALLVFLWMKFQLINKKTAIAALLVSYLSIFFLMSRFVDRHIQDLSYAYWGVTEGLIIVNYLHTLIGFGSIIYMAFNIFKEKYFVRDSSNSGNFSARGSIGFYSNKTK